jgi:hypothetical protein
VKKGQSRLQNGGRIGSGLCWRWDGMERVRVGGGLDGEGFAKSFVLVQKTEKNLKLFFFPLSGLPPISKHTK